jgi:hypothetical protein
VYYGFQTENEERAIAALLVYGVYKSRDVSKFKTSRSWWGTVQDAVRSSATMANGDLFEFVQRLQAKLKCPAIKPYYMATASNIVTSAVLPTGELVELKEQGRNLLWSELVEEADHEAVLEHLERKTGSVISLVQHRIEREKALYERGIIDVEEVEEGDDFDEE